MGVKAKTKASTRTAKAAAASSPAPVEPSQNAEASTSANTLHVLDTTQGEIALLRALTRHRPVGPDKQIKMMSLLSIVNKALLNIDKEEGQPDPTVTSEEIWDKLGRMYNLETLDNLNTPSSPSNDSPAADGPAHPDSPSHGDGRRKRGRPSRSPGAKALSGIEENDSDSTLSQEEDADGEEQVKEEEHEQEEAIPTPKKRRKTTRR